MELKMLLYVMNNIPTVQHPAEIQNPSPLENADVNVIDLIPIAAPDS